MTDWDAVLDTNLKAVFRRQPCCHSPDDEAARLVASSASPAWWAASGNPGQANYAAAKAGVAGMTPRPGS